MLVASKGQRSTCYQVVLAIGSVIGAVIGSIYWRTGGEAREIW